MASEQDEHYQPWLRHRGQPGDGQTPASQPVAPSAPRPDAVRLSADELFARPAPLPVADDAQDGLSDRLAAGLDRARDLVDAANQRIEPARRARAAARVLGRTSRSLLSATGRASRAAIAATASASRRAAQVATPVLQSAAEQTRAGLTKGASAATASLSRAGDVGKAMARDATARLGPADRQATDDAARPAPVEAPAVPPRAVPSEALPLFAGAGEQSAPPLTTASAATGSPAAAPSPRPQAQVPPPPPPPVARGSGGGDGGRGTPSLTASAWLRHPATWALGAVALLLAGFAGGQYYASDGLSRAEMAEVVRETLLAQPGIIPEAMQRMQANQASEVVQRLRTRIHTPFSGAWAGNANGDVTLTVFSDYGCTFCRQSEADLERLLREDRQLKVVFRELPILSPESEAAARLALVAARRGRYMPMHRALFEAGSPDASARAAAAGRLGVVAAPADLADAAISREIESNLELARELRIDGTPSWVVGDRLLVGAVGYDQLRRAIAEARAAG